MQGEHLEMLLRGKVYGQGEEGRSEKVHPIFPYDWDLTYWKERVHGRGRDMDW
jgi:hypothetical protein